MILFKVSCAPYAFCYKTHFMLSDEIRSASIFSEHRRSNFVLLGLLVSHSMQSLGKVAGFMKLLTDSSVIFCCAFVFSESESLSDEYPAEKEETSRFYAEYPDSRLKQSKYEPKLSEIKEVHWIQPSCKLRKYDTIVSSFATIYKEKHSIVQTNPTLSWLGTDTRSTIRLYPASKPDISKAVLGHALSDIDNEHNRDLSTLQWLNLETIGTKPGNHSRKKTSKHTSVDLILQPRHRLNISSVNILKTFSDTSFTFTNSSGTISSTSYLAASESSRKLENSDERREIQIDSTNSESTGASASVKQEWKTQDFDDHTSIGNAAIQRQPTYSTHLFLQQPVRNLLESYGVNCSTIHGTKTKKNMAFLLQDARVRDISNKRKNKETTYLIRSKDSRNSRSRIENRILLHKRTHVLWHNKCGLIKPNLKRCRGVWDLRYESRSPPWALST